jgi:hypothetical protein
MVARLLLLILGKRPRIVDYLGDQKRLVNAALNRSSKCDARSSTAIC